MEALICSLRQHENTAEYFYRIRDFDRDKEFYGSLSRVEKASRLLYLNRTCYNGLFRVNASGEFNTPFGRYKNPTIVNEPVLRAVSRYLSAAHVRLLHEDFADTLRRVPRGGFVYLDPPYDPVSDTASFTGYSKGGFGREDQRRLRDCCDDLTRRGVKFCSLTRPRTLSGSCTRRIRWKRYTPQGRSTRTPPGGARWRRC